MDRAKAAALCCLLAVACGGDREQTAGAGSEGSGGAPSAANQPPVIESVSLDPADPRPGQLVNARVEASDPEGDRIALDYRWRVDGVPVQHADGASSFHVEGYSPGTSIEVTVVARDAHGESAPQSAPARIGNRPPTIVQVVLKPLGAVTAGNDITASVTASDPEGDAIEYRYHWRVNGETALFDGPTLPAKAVKRGDRIGLEVVASDGDDECEPLQSLPIEVVNAPPKIVSTPGAIGADGVFRYAIQAEDPDGDRVFRYRLEKSPAGMTVGFSDGQVQWVPPLDAAGSHDVEIAVEDGFGAASKQKFALQLSFDTDPITPTDQREAPADAGDGS